MRQTKRVHEAPKQMVGWTANVEGMTVEQAVEVRNAHIREHHPRARIPKERA